MRTRIPLKVKRCIKFLLWICGAIIILLCYHSQTVRNFTAVCTDPFLQNQKPVKVLEGSVGPLIPVKLPTEAVTVPSIPRTTTTVQTKTITNTDVACDKVNYTDPTRMLFFNYWPLFRGYNAVKASAKTDPEDPLLLDRILLSQKTVKQPRFRLKKDPERHPWKFEKIIHQTWISEKVPERTVSWTKKWVDLHPDWTYMFWTDTAAREFLYRYYPSLLPVYDSWTLPVQKADMFRYVVLYAFGGIYADLDVEPLKKLDEIRDWAGCILSREADLQTFVMVSDLNGFGNNYTYTCNALMACRSHHPFFHYLLGRLVQWSPLVRRQPCKLKELLSCTGPTLLSLSYGFYRRSVARELRKSRKELDVICPKSEWFLPTFDNSRLNIVRKKCRSPRLKGKAREACNTYKHRKMKNVPLEYSFTNHHQFHSYTSDVMKKLVDIRNVTKPSIWPTVNDEEHFHICYEG